MRSPAATCRVASADEPAESRAAGGSPARKWLKRMANAAAAGEEEIPTV
jgi:hypothetical protein